MEHLICQELGVIQNENGEVALREILLKRDDGQCYSISFATPEHLQYWERTNQARPDTDTHLDTRAFPISPVPSVIELCQMLHEGDFSRFEPYLELVPNKLI